MSFVRTRGDLVRHGDRAGIIAEVNRRNNTAYIRHADHFVWHSWWDLREGVDVSIDWRIAASEPGVARVVPRSSWTDVC